MKIPKALSNRVFKRYDLGDKVEENEKFQKAGNGFENSKGA